MKRAALALLLAVGSLPAAAQDERPPIPLDHLPALAGDYFHLPWPEQQRGFHIYVRLPADYAAQPDRHFPVVYLLDGDAAFPILAPIHLLLTYDEQMPEAIVVGIAYGGFDPSVNRRDVDYTGPAPGTPEAEARAPAFHAFLEDRLLPEVERRYRADPDRRILVGQSRGGSFVLYSALSRPDVFWGRIASNPSFWRDGERHFGAAATASRPDLRLFYASGSRDRPQGRAGALRWFESWRNRPNKPWALRFVTIEGGTHAANLTDAYRAGMLWLLSPPSP